jgi:hypothetical protein
MLEIPCVLEGEDLIDSEYLENLSVSDLVCYKCARLVSCDVEHYIFSVQIIFFRLSWHRSETQNKAGFCGSLLRFLFEMSINSGKCDHG